MVRTTKGLSALTVEQVRAIRQEYGARKYGTREAVTQQELAKRYGVSQKAISDVIRRNTYKDVV